MSSWLEVRIDTNSQGLEPIGNLLEELGIPGYEIEDETEFRTFLEENRQYWDYVDESLEAEMRGKSRIKFYVEQNPEGLEQLARVRMALRPLQEQCGQDLGPLLVTLKGLEAADWENNWKQYYKPQPVGQRLMIVPAWESADPGDRIPVVLNPGLIFGTGSHATTRLCLEGLEKLVHGGENVLDLGCGSGILSIAALKLGAAEATAVDIDDKCLHVAYENAALNGIGRDTYTVRIGDILRDEALQAAIGGGYQVVLANIVADVIIGLAPAVRGLLAEGGVFLCSGIIDSRAGEVADQLRKNGLEILETHSDDGWFAYLCR